MVDGLMRAAHMPMREFTAMSLIFAMPLAVATFARLASAPCRCRCRRRCHAVIMRCLRFDTDYAS